MTRMRITGAGRAVQSVEWHPGKPKESGCYLAAWRAQSGQLIVSEFWFNNGDGRGTWWATRGYLEVFGAPGPFLSNSIDSVYAWATLLEAPDPAHWPKASQ